MDEALALAAQALRDALAKAEIWAETSEPLIERLLKAAERYGADRGSLEREYELCIAERDLAIALGGMDREQKGDLIWPVRDFYRRFD